MIITLTQANFSACSIGTLTTCNVKQSTVIGATVNISKTSVEKAGYTTATEIATISLDTSNYKDHNITVMMGSNDVTGEWYSSSTGKVTIPANTPITSTITISVSATAIQVTPPSGGDEPVTPTMYTFTINPTPSDATVTLTATGYTQSGKSITVPSGTSVSWNVEATGYTSQYGTHTVTKTESKSVTLSATGGMGGTSGESIDLSTLSLNHCSSSKIGSGDKENLSYNTETHEITCNSKGWYKCSYFTQPVTVGMEIEFDCYASSSITGNYFGIWEEGELIDGVSEVQGSFWPAATFGIYASGANTSNSGEPLYMWDTVAKTKIEGSAATDFNSKTIKYVIKETGIEVYNNGEKVQLPRIGNILQSDKRYFFGMHQSCGNKSSICSKMLYMGPIR